jgi:hypothetical protein
MRKEHPWLGRINKGIAIANRAMAMLAIAILITLLSLSGGCQSWHPSEKLLEVELCADGDSSLLVRCECVLEVAEDRHDFEEFRANKGLIMARLESQGVVSRCVHGLPGEVE